MGICGGQKRGNGGKSKKHKRERGKRPFLDFFIFGLFGPFLDHCWSKWGEANDGIGIRMIVWMDVGNEMMRSCMLVLNVMGCGGSWGAGRFDLDV